MVATANRRDRYRFPPVWLGLAVGVIVLAFLSAALIFRASSRSHSARVGSLQAPTGLRARQVSAAEVRFSWRGIPHATAYLVDVGLDQFYTRVPSLMVSGVLEPGKQYTWWVEGQLQDRQGPRSERVSLRLRPLPARSWRFYPSPLPVDQVLVTLYNPNTSASEARLQVKNALATRTHVRLPPVEGPGASRRCFPPHSIRGRQSLGHGGRYPGTPR